MATPKRPTREQIELNKRKQQALKLAGYDIDINGSWGPWQEQQYRKISTHKKQYPTDILGFLTSVKDRITGNDTYYQEPIAQDKVSQDNRSKLQRDISYQLNHNNTPLGYVARTVAPAAAISTAAVYGAPAISKMTGPAARIVQPISSGIKGGVKQGFNNAAKFMVNEVPKSAVLQTPQGVTVSTPTSARIPKGLLELGILGLGTVGALSTRRPARVHYADFANSATEQAEAAQDSITTTPTDTISPVQPKPESKPEPENSNKGWRDKLADRTANLIRGKKTKSSKTKGSDNNLNDNSSNNNGFIKTAQRILWETNKNNYGPSYGWRNAARLPAYYYTLKGVGDGSFGRGLGLTLGNAGNIFEGLGQGFKEGYNGTDSIQRPDTVVQVTQPIVQNQKQISDTIPQPTQIVQDSTASQPIQNNSVQKTDSIINKYRTMINDNF